MHPRRGGKKPAVQLDLVYCFSPVANLEVLEEVLVENLALLSQLRAIERHLQTERA